MTAQNLAKREEARRVWRLNKKESIPVLEALETADISKDTYYSYKGEYESDWEGQLLSAKDVEERLERLSEELVDLREEAELVEERLDQAEEMTEAVEEVEDALVRADQAESHAYQAKQSLETIERELGISIDAETAEVDASLSEVAERQEQIGAEYSSLSGRVEELEETLAKEQRQRQDGDDNLREQIPESVWELL